MTGKPFFFSFCSTAVPRFKSNTSLKKRGHQAEQTQNDVEVDIVTRSKNSIDNSGRAVWWLCIERGEKRVHESNGEGPLGLLRGGPDATKPAARAAQLTSQAFKRLMAAGMSLSKFVYRQDKSGRAPAT